MADRYLQLVINKSLEVGGLLYMEETGQISGSTVYMNNMKTLWRDQLVKKGGDEPLLQRVIENFGHESDKKRKDINTCDVGYLFTSVYHTVQAMHVDYTRHAQMLQNWVAFMPLTAAGMFVEIWPGRPTKENTIIRVGKKVDDKRLEGAIVFIPKGVLLLVRGDTVHAGAMHCDTYKNPYGNPRHG